jgi:hypothetical protein
MMSDLAAGSSAVEQLQRNVAEAPYIKDLTQAGAERKIQEDRLAKQYAPEMMAAKAEEEQMRLQTARLQKLATETQYTRDKESTAQLEQWLQTDEGKKASDLDVIRKSASLKMHAGLTEQGSKLYERAEKEQALELANQAKQLAQNNETIAQAAVVLDAVPDDQVEEYFNRLPGETKNLITKQVGEENWNKATGEQKKKIVDRLFLNTKGQLTEQLKAVELEKTKLITKNKLDVENAKEASAKVLKTMTVESAEKIATEKIAAREKELQTKFDQDIKKLEKKHEGEIDKLKQQTVDKTELENLKAKHKKEIENLRESGKTTRAAAKTDVKDATFYIKEHDKIVKSGEKQEQALQENVNSAEKLLTESKTASWYEPKAYKEDKRTKAYTAAVSKLNDFRKQQTQREIETFENAPDFPKKEQILRKLRERLAAVDTPPLDKEPPPAKAEAPKAAPAAAPAKDVPSNKPLSESEFSKQWPTLKKGQSLIGPDGKTYTKGG